MGAFELNAFNTRNDVHNDTHRETHSAEELSSVRPQPECTIALKVYDSCLLKKCLDDLGAVYEFVDDVCTSNRLELTGDLENADEVKVVSARVIITNIRKKTRRNNTGFWDVTIRFTFVYELEFYRDGELLEVDGKDYVEACDSFAKTVTLYGAPEIEDLMFATDLINEESHGTELHEELPNLKSEPFVWVEAKAVGLCAEIHTVPNPGPGPRTRREVHVTVGLYAIIKLFRLVNLSVMSTGLCKIPDECSCEAPICEDPCVYFKNMDFPTDIFSPPSKP